MNRKQRRAEKKQSKPTLHGLFADGVQHHRAGRLDEAARLYQEVLAVNSYHADSRHMLGMIAHQLGHADLAVDMITGAIAIDAGVAEYHSNLGNALVQLGRLPDAVACLRSAIELKPHFPEGHFNLGVALAKLGQLDEAATSYRFAINLKPDFPVAHNNLGHTLIRLEQTAQAIDCLNRAIELKPDYAEAHSNLGDALGRLGRLDEAVACYRTALDLNPGYSDAHNNLGTALAYQGRQDDAIACYHRSIDLDPNFAEAYANLGNAFAEQGRRDDALAGYRMAIDLKSDFPDAHTSLAMALLSRGDMEAGWEEYEWRWKTRDGIVARRNFLQPQWRGEAAGGQTLLIHAEQGLGDTIQFCRYATIAATRGLRVILQVQKPLVRLLRSLSGADLVVGIGEELPSFDLQCPMLSMPLAFGTTIESIPVCSSYLHADTVQTAAWQERLAAMPNQGLRIGLVWAGAAREAPALAAVDRRRSLAPGRLATLLGVPGLQFFSLQRAGPAMPEKFRLTDHMDEMEDFADTAALIANLDLVISVDTAVAHLAAALGKPVWVLDRFDPCWRWLFGRRDSPWYPTLRLYRQPHPGDWDSVVAEMASDLRAMAGACYASRSCC